MIAELVEGYRRSAGGTFHGGRSWEMRAPGIEGGLRSWAMIEMRKRGRKKERKWGRREEGEGEEGGGRADRWAGRCPAIVA